MVIKELDKNKINNVFLKLTKEIEKLRKSNSERESDIAELNGA
jgi:predicted  nucleic acid-binding Zn-ribbon protein